MLMSIDEIDSILNDEFIEETGCRLDDVVGDKEVILYGAGDGLITFYNFVVNKFGMHVKAILDNKFESKTQWHEIASGALSDFDFGCEVRRNAVVIITVGKIKYHEQIVGQLKDYGFENIVFAFDIYEYHLSHSLSNLSDVSLDYFRLHGEEIKLAYSQLADNLSRRVFISVFRTYISKKPVPVPNSPLKDQYFPSDVMLKKGVNRFINCGAYDGDTLKELKKRYCEIDALACFEPDLSNYAKLSGYLNESSSWISGLARIFHSKGRANPAFAI